MSENEILLVDGIEYSLWLPKREDELERSIKHHSKRLFGSDSIYFDVKKQIKSSIGVATIPDAYLVDFNDNAFYLVEIELSNHPEYEHINKQIGKFISALNNYQSRQKVARILKDYIEDDIIRKKFVIDKIGNIELYQYFLEDILERVKDQNYHTIIVIDKITAEISEACSILSPRPKIIEFRTFVRKNVGDLRVHSHLFQPLVSEKTISERPTKTIQRGYTGKKLEKARLFNETIEVSTWKDLLVKTSEKLIIRSPEEFDKLADSKIMRGEKKYYLTKNTKILNRSHQLSSGIFLEINLSAEQIVSVIKKRLLPGCGYKETDIEIFTKD